MRLGLIFVYLFIFSISAFSQKIPTIPNPPRLVNDYIGLLNQSEKESLEKVLVENENKTSNQIAIVIISSLDGYTIEEYSNKLFNSWGIGTKEKNNGILILISKQERKIRIEVGYGLERAIPDNSANEIINNDIKPYFKQKEFFKGLYKAVLDLSAAAQKEVNIQHNGQKKSN